MAKDDIVIFNYHGEPARKMTKGEMKNYIKHRGDCEAAYKAMLDGGYFHDNDSDKYKLDVLIGICAGIQSNICALADIVKIDNFGAIQKEVCKDLTKQTFMEMVNWIKSHHADPTNKIDEVRHQATKEYSAKLTNHVIKDQVFKTFGKTKCFEIPVDTSVNLQRAPEVSLKMNKRFTTLLMDSAEARTIIDEEYYPAYKVYAMVAEHISHGKLDYKTFKRLVDWHYYADLDAKWNKYKASSVIKPFKEMYDICKTYGFGFFDEIEQHILDSVEQYDAKDA